MPETTADIIAEAVTQLEEREQRLRAVIEQAKPELAQVRTTLRALRKTSANGRGPKSPPPADAVSAPVEVKDAILRELEASPSLQAGPLAEAISADADSVRAALLDLQRTGDVESYGKGRWRIVE